MPARVGSAGWDLHGRISEIMRRASQRGSRHSARGAGGRWTHDLWAKDRRTREVMSLVRGILKQSARRVLVRQGAVYMPFWDVKAHSAAAIAWPAPDDGGKGRSSGAR